MLVLGVVVVAIVGGAYTFVPSFKHGTQTLAQDVERLLSTQLPPDQGVAPRSRDSALPAFPDNPDSLQNFFEEQRKRNDHTPKRVTTAKDGTDSHTNGDGEVERQMERDLGIRFRRGTNL